MAVRLRPLAAHPRDDVPLVSAEETGTEGAHAKLLRIRALDGGIDLAVFTSSGQAKAFLLDHLVNLQGLGNTHAERLGLSREAALADCAAAREAFPDCGEFAFIESKIREATRPGEPDRR